MGSSNEPVREQRMELSPTHREECQELEWVSFRGLNETFQTEGPEGCWVEWGDFTSDESGENNAFYGKKHTEESKQRMREAYLRNYEKGFHPRKKPCVYKGVWYPSQKAASEATGVPQTTITRHIRGLNRPR